jgi:hypothetical protein
MKDKDNENINNSVEGMVPERGIGSYDGPEDIDSYREYTKAIALEPSVFDSQQDYVNQMWQKVSTSSSDVVRDDENLVNPRWGLPRYSQYRTAIPMSDVRMMPTEYPTQMPESNPYLIN